MVTILWKWLLLALGVSLAAHTARGIAYDGFQSLLFAVVMLSLLNAFLKPLLILFAFPFVVFTMGLGIIVINAFLFWLAGQIIPGFSVAGLVPALWGAFVVTIVHLFVEFLFRSQRRVSTRYAGTRKPRSSRRWNARTRSDDDKIIDV